MQNKFRFKGNRDIRMEHTSILPQGKKWHLVWNDEFDGNSLDLQKWDFRRHLLQCEHKTFCGEEGLAFPGDSCVHLKRIRKADGEFYSCQLQTGCNYMDVPGEKFYSEENNPNAPKFVWPISRFKTPKFMHRFGYYEICCKLQKTTGWWSAFWLQSPIIGCCPDPGIAGVEVDIMEAFQPNGTFDCNNHWNGYGPDHCETGTANHGKFKLRKTVDDFHLFGLDWSPEGYVYYADGEKVWECNAPVSNTEQFILISTECKGYRYSMHAAPELAGADQPDDEFVVDFVRVYDEVKD